MAAPLSSVGRTDARTGIFVSVPARSSGWLGSIAEQRLQIADQLEERPNLKGFVDEAVEKAYPKAVTLAERETALASCTFPQTCPFSLRELIDDEFFPSP